MSDYVIDASVIIERLIRGQYTANVRVLFKRLTSTDRLIIPEFCLLECTNVLWKHVRFHGLPQPQAISLLRDLRGLPLQRAPFKRLLNKALEIGLKHNLAIYDSAYVVLATHFGLSLITLDVPQSRAAAAEGITLKPVTDFVP